MRNLLIAAFLLTATAASADPASREDQLRDALRQATGEMRAAQDSVATLQAQLATAQQQQAALQAQLDAANAKLAQPSKPAADPAQIAQARAQMAAAQAQNAQLQQGMAKWQAAYQQAADIARAKDAESRNAGTALNANTQALATCKAMNAKLVGVAEDTLHLYGKLSFRAVLLKSYDPIIGTARVTLENTVQDYDDRIRDQEYHAPAAPR